MKRKDHIRVGVFVVASLAIFLALVFGAIGAQLGEREARYSIHFEETVKGMVVGSPVNFQGVRIGRVADMRFVSGQTEVSILVDPSKAPIQDNTVASLDRAWVTGQVTVELKGWEADGEALEEYGIIKAELSPGARVMQSMPELAVHVAAILEDFGGVAQRLKVLLDDEGPWMHSVEGLLGDLRRSTQRVHRSTLPAVEAALADARRVTPKLERALEAWTTLAARAESVAGDPQLKSLAVEAGALLRDVRQRVPQLAAVARELEVFFRGNRGELRSVLRNLATAMREIGDVARVMQQAPNALLFGYRKNEAPSDGVQGRPATPASPDGGQR